MAPVRSEENKGEVVGFFVVVVFVCFLFFRNSLCLHITAELLTACVSMGCVSKENSSLMALGTQTAFAYRTYILYFVITLRERRSRVKLRT